eukprot:jgi/Mesvir1/21273/Mv21672-RA.1
MARRLWENSGAAVMNWFPGHMAKASREIRDKLKGVDLVLEVRDARIPLSSTNEHLEELCAHKRRLIVFNKRDLADPRQEKPVKRLVEHGQSSALFVSALEPASVRKLLQMVRETLRERPLDSHLCMVLGMPNVGKSALINALRRAAPAGGRGSGGVAVTGPTAGVTRAISGFKLAQSPSTYLLDTPGVMVPKVKDFDTGLKLALTGAVKDTVVDERDRVRYLLRWLSERAWGQAELANGTTSKLVVPRSPIGDAVNAAISTSEQAPYASEDERSAAQMDALMSCLNIPQAGMAHNWETAQRNALQKVLMAYRVGALGRFTLDEIQKDKLREV